MPPYGRETQWFFKSLKRQKLRFIGQNHAIKAYYCEKMTKNKNKKDSFITLNNLPDDDTADLFNTLNAVLKIGTAENLNMQVGTMAVNALIGTKDNPGFAYSMKAIGAKYFMFATSADADYFIVN